MGSGKGNGMGRRGDTLKSRNRAMLGVFGPPILLLVLIVVGIYVYNAKFGDKAAAYDDAISECVRDRTRVATSSAVQDQATSDCVRDTAPETSR